MAGAPLSKVGDEIIDKQFNLLQGKCIGTKPCTKIICYLKVGIYHGKESVETSLWYIVNIYQ